MILKNTVLKHVLIDPEDSDLEQFRWVWGSGDYVLSARYGGGKRWSYRLHRIVLERKIGRPLSRGEVADHINGNKFDNRRANLRVATSQQNAWNRRAMSKSLSPFVAVWLSNRSKRWAAFVKRDGIRYHIGYFDTQEEAAWMRDQCAQVLHEEFARLNFDYVGVTWNKALDEIRTAVRPAVEETA